MVRAKTLEKNIGLAETKFCQCFCTKHGKIIVCVFNMILHKTWNQNRLSVLSPNWHAVLICVFACNIKKQLKWMLHFFGRTICSHVACLVNVFDQNNGQKMGSLFNHKGCYDPNMFCA